MSPVDVLSHIIRRKNCIFPGKFRGHLICGLKGFQLGNYIWHYIYAFHHIPSYCTEFETYVDVLMLRSPHNHIIHLFVHTS